MSPENISTNTAIEKISWAGIFETFLNSPPTSSVFRLYLLSFIIWNKGVLLYIFFAKADMADKLAFGNWSKYVLFQSCKTVNTCEVSKLSIFIIMHLIPLLIALIICLIVFGYKKFPSIYSLVYKEHIKAEKDRLSDEIEVLEKRKERTEKESSVVDEEIKTENKKEELRLVVENKLPKPIPPKDLKDAENSYRNFTKTSLKRDFISNYEFLAYQQFNLFPIKYAYLKLGDALLIFLLRDECFCLEDQSPFKPKEYEIIKIVKGLSGQIPLVENPYIRFSKKGLYYIACTEWEEKTGLSV